jgi:hypothetical protein
MGTQQATDFLENKIIDHLFRATTWTKPAALYLALFTSPPSDSGGGTEVIGGAYTRVAFPPSDTNWTATQGGTTGASSGTGGQTTNALAITFPAPTANWGTVTHFAVMDASVGGNMLIWDALVASRTILSGDPAPSFPIGALAIAVN